MTTITADYEHDSSRSGHKSSSTMEHQNNGQGKPEDERKLFVGGLTWDTTTDDLREYFTNFGPVLECSIKQDPTTGRSRGFAFLVFESKDVVEKVLSQSDHFVKGRKVDPKPAHRRMQTNNVIPTLNNNNNNNHHHHQQQHHHHHSAQSAIYGMATSGSMSYSTMSMPSNVGNASNNNRKVFIGGLDPNFPDTQLREYFSKFGQIDEIDLPFDKEKNERRPFCFISFLSEQAAQEVLRLQRHTIGDISVDVKRAKPKTANNQQHQQRGHLYDPYGQHTAAYANYNATIPSYGGAPYQPAAAAAAADQYANWNAYNYNAQVNQTGAFSYSNNGQAGVSSPGTSGYPTYAEHQSNAQYQLQTLGTAAVTDYYPQYPYGAPVPAATGVYQDPNAYAGGNYEYGQYYSAMNAGMVDNGAGQTSGNPTDHELDNRHGKAKTTILADSLYHPYARN